MPARRPLPPPLLVLLLLLLAAPRAAAATRRLAGGAPSNQTEAKRAAHPGRAAAEAALREVASYYDRFAASTPVPTTPLALLTYLDNPYFNFTALNFLTPLFTTFASNPAPPLFSTVDNTSFVYAPSLHGNGTGR